jgi:hypothetical protein
LETGLIEVCKALQTEPDARAPSGPIAPSHDLVISNTPTPKGRDNRALYSLWNRFRDMLWQRIVGRGLSPLAVGLVIAGGYVMARAADVGWQSAVVALGAMALMLPNADQPAVDARRRWSSGRSRTSVKKEDQVDPAGSIIGA